MSIFEKLRSDVSCLQPASLSSRVANILFTLVCMVFPTVSYIMSYSFYVMCLTVSMASPMLLYGFYGILHALCHVLSFICYFLWFLWYFLGPTGPPVR